jgi:hypothetical protein
MKTTLKKAELVGKISLSGQDYIVAQSEGALVGLIGDCQVVSILEQDTSPEALLSVLVDILHMAMQKTGASASDLLIYAGDWDTAGKYPSEEYLRQTLEKLNRDIGDVAVLEGCSDITNVEQSPCPVSTAKLMDNLASFQRRLLSILDATEILLDKAYLIQRVKLVESMWGVPDVLAEMKPAKGLMRDQDKLLQSLGRQISLSNKATARMTHRIKGGVRMTAEDGKYVVTTVIPEILNACHRVGEILSVILGNLSPIYHLDTIFKKHTKNSVTWSIPGNLLLEFSEAFRVLLQFLLDTPTVEKGVIEPLELIQKEIEKSLLSMAVTR